jgi:hypothetical protein
MASPGDVRSLIQKMHRANPLWGAPRIHGELRTLGVDVSERTVSRLLAPQFRPRSQTWKTFLTKDNSSFLCPPKFPLASAGSKLSDDLARLSFRTERHPTRFLTA